MDQGSWCIGWRCLRLSAAVDQANGVPGSVRSSAVAQELAAVDAGLLVVLDGYLAVDQDVAVALGVDHRAELLARQVVYELGFAVREFVVVVDDDVGRRALDQHAAVGESRAARRQAGQSPV